MLYRLPNFLLLLFLLNFSKVSISCDLLVFFRSATVLDPFAMRLSAALLLLPAFVLADEQKPLKEKAAAWFDKAKAYIPTAPAVPIADAGASAVASKKLERININNWERKLAPSPSGPQEWMILVSGKNDSCWGGCDGVNQAWNVSVLPANGRLSPPREHI